MCSQRATDLGAGYGKGIRQWKFYHLERYLLEEVGPRFRSSGTIDPIDLFIIFVWKANRAKTRVRDNLKRRANGSFSEAASKIASALSAAKDQKERLGILMQDWGLRLQWRLQF